MRYFIFLISSLLIVSCGTNNSVHNLKTYTCDEGFSIAIRDSSEVKIASISHKNKEIASLHFTDKDGKLRSNELTLSRIDSVLSITLSGTEVYSNCLVESLRKKKFMVTDEKEAISSFIITDLLLNNADSIHPAQRQYVYNRYDLNGNGDYEYIVIPMSQNFCNDDGCLIYILNTDFKMHSKIRIGGPPICIEHAAKGKYKNILFQTDHKMRRAIVDESGKYPEESIDLPIVEDTGYKCDPIFDGGFPEERLSY